MGISKREMRQNSGYYAKDEGMKIVWYPASCSILSWSLIHILHLSVSHPPPWANPSGPAAPSSTPQLNFSFHSPARCTGAFVLSYLSVRPPDFSRPTVASIIRHLPHLYIIMPARGLDSIRMYVSSSILRAFPHELRKHQYLYTECCKSWRALAFFSALDGS